MRALDWLLDLLYPPKCVICRRLLARGEQDICPDCFESLPNFEGEKPQVGGADGLGVTLFYEGAVRESFLRFKFSGRDFYADVYGTWMEPCGRRTHPVHFPCVPMRMFPGKRFF